LLLEFSVTLAEVISMVLTVLAEFEQLFDDTLHIHYTSSALIGSGVFIIDNWRLKFWSDIFLNDLRF